MVNQFLPRPNLSVPQATLGCCRLPWAGLSCSGLLRAGAAGEAGEAIRLFHMLHDCPISGEISNRKSILARAVEI